MFHISNAEYSLPYTCFQIYKGKIYFGENISALVKVKNNGETVDSHEIIYTQIIRANLDGSKPEIVFKYDNEYKEEEPLGAGLPYISISCEFSGNELIASLYIGDAPNKYYRMNLDGTNVSFIGELKGFSAN